MRLILIVAVAGAALGAPPQPVSPGSAVDRAVLDRYCTGCHNSKTKTGGLDLVAASAERVDKSPAVWEKVVRKLTARYMPPAGLPKPDERTYDALIATLVKSLDATAAAKPNPGR